MNQTFSVTLDAPDGYEFTGEYRLPVSGELHLDELGQAITDRSPLVKSFILRRAWTPPAWLPIENWLYNNGAEWRLSNREPRVLSNGYYQNAPGSSGVKIRDFAAIMGQTFVPPPQHAPRMYAI